MDVPVAESYMPGSSQLMSECDSTVFGEGYLATTLDRKDKQTIFQNGMFLRIKMTFTCAASSTVAKLLYIMIYSYQDSPVVSHKADKKQHTYTQPMQFITKVVEQILMVCFAGFT